MVVVVVVAKQEEVDDDEWDEMDGGGGRHDGGNNSRDSLYISSHAVICPCPSKKPSPTPISPPFGVRRNKHGSALGSWKNTSKARAQVVYNTARRRFPDDT
jgi:hypothetical protein